MELYKDWINENNAILILALNKSNLDGFVLGIKNKDLLFNPIKKHPFKYFKFVMLGLIKKPLLFSKLIETLFYKGKSTSNIKGELLVIVTNEETRSMGLGSEMVKMLNTQFMKCNIKQYLVTVHAEMQRSNNFYIKNQMELEKSFDFYGTKWNMYKKTINLL